MVPLVCIPRFFWVKCVEEMLSVSVELFIQDWALIMTCWSPLYLKLHPSIWHSCGWGASQSKKLRRRYPNEYIQFEGDNPPQEPAFSIHNSVIIYCHMLLWLIEADLVEQEQAGFEPGAARWKLFAHWAIVQDNLSSLFVIREHL